MKKNIFILAAIALTVGMSSCETVHQTASQQFVKSSEIMTMTTAELSVAGEHVTYTYNPTKSIRRGGEENCVNVAIQKALEPSGGDVLVETRKAIIARRGLFKKIKSVTVSGYPAKYTNFKSADNEYILKTYKEGLEASKNPIAKAIEKKKSKWSWITGLFHKK